MAKRLTDRRRAIVLYCHEVIEATGYPPSITEIRRACGIPSNGGAYHDMSALVDMGFIEFAGSRRMKVLRLP